MKQSESNYLTMVQSVLANMRKDQAFWSGEPEIVSEVDAIETLLLRICIHHVQRGWC